MIEKDIESLDWQKIMSEVLNVPGSRERWLTTAFTPGPHESYSDPCGAYHRSLILERLRREYGSCPTEVLTGALKMLAKQGELKSHNWHSFEWPKVAKAVRLPSKPLSYLPQIWPLLGEEFKRLNYEQLAQRLGIRIQDAYDLFRNYTERGITERKGLQTGCYKKGPMRRIAVYPNNDWQNGRVFNLEVPEEMEELHRMIATQTSVEAKVSDEAPPFTLERIRFAFVVAPDDNVDPCGYIDMETILSRLAPVFPELDKKQTVHGLHRLVLSGQLEKKAVYSRDYLRLPGGNYALRLGKEKSLRVARNLVRLLRQSVGPMHEHELVQQLTKLGAQQGYSDKLVVFTLIKLIEAGGIVRLPNNHVKLGRPVQIAVYPRPGYENGQVVDLWSEPLDEVPTPPVQVESPSPEAMGIALGPVATLPVTAAQVLRFLEERLDEWRQLLQVKQPLQALRHSLLAAGKSPEQVEQALHKLVEEVGLGPSEAHLAALAASLELWRKHLEAS